MALEAWARRRLRTFQDAERGLCFGRLTLDAALRPLYVGRRWVHDDRHEVLVVNWQAPAARPFYTATPAEPQRCDAASPLPHRGPAPDGHLGRVARRHRGRRRVRLRLPARGARPPPRGADARHRRDDPVRPVPADHGRARGRARRPGRPRHGQDGRRPPPRVVASVHAPRAAAARARRRAEPDVHGLRLARAPGARRGGGRAARRLRAARRDRGRARGGGRRRAAEGRPPSRRRRAARGRARGAAGAAGARPLRRRRLRLGEAA